MPPTLRLIAITPKRKPIDLIAQGAKITAGMVRFGADMQQSMAKYPPARPWKSRTPRSGPRKHGRRTGGLGRGWQVRFTYSQGVAVECVVGNFVPYSPYVQGLKRGAKGERQTKVMRDRGWQNITDTAGLVWKRNQGVIVQAIRAGA